MLSVNYKFMQNFGNIIMLTHRKVKSRGFLLPSALKGRLCQKATPREQTFGSTRAALLAYGTIEAVKSCRLYCKLDHPRFEEIALARIGGG